MVQQSHQPSAASPDASSHGGSVTSHRDRARGKSETGQTNDATPQARLRAEQEVNELKQHAIGAAESANASGRRYAEEKKRRAADELGVLSGAIRKASTSLREDQQGPIADYADAAAEQLDRFRTSLESKGLGEIFNDVQTCARRHPTVTYGTMFVAGLAAVRFFRSSNADRVPRQGPKSPSMNQSRPHRTERLDLRNFSDPAERPATAFGHDPTMNDPSEPIQTTPPTRHFGESAAIRHSSMRGPQG